MIRWNCTIDFYKKILTGAIFLFGLAANMFRTSRFFNGCMKCQHAVILKSTWERDATIIFFPAERTGLLSPLLTCFTFLFFSPLLGQVILSPTPFLHLFLFNKIIQSPLLFSLCSSWTKYFKFNSKSTRIFQVPFSF